jgi:hypothetical protein
MTKVVIAPAVNELNRKLWLKRKHAKEPFQLTLSLNNDNLRHIPNEIARAALFTTRDKREQRRAFLSSRLFSLAETIQVNYSGHELRAEDDELVWMQIIHFGLDRPFGEPFTFRIIDLLKGLDWPTSATYYEKARNSLARLSTCEIEVESKEAFGTTGYFRLLDRFKALNDEKGEKLEFTVCLSREMVFLFAGNTFTSHKWDVYRNLTAIGRKLADYAGSHKTPYPLTLERFAALCDSNYTDPKNWRKRVKKACEELKEHGLIQDYRIENKKITLQREPPASPC